MMLLASLLAAAYYDGGEAEPLFMAAANVIRVSLGQSRLSVG